MSTLAIIGTAGRGSDGKRLASDPKLYLDTMKRAALKVAERVGATTLVSGGAAWADHIAVILFLLDSDRLNLELELPAPLGLSTAESVYEDNGQRDARTNPGGTANHYHRLFRRAIQSFDPDGCPFIDLALVRPSDHLPFLRRAKITVTPGFLARNLVVASKADHVLAMTFGDGRLLKDGGTAHTMRHFLARNHGSSYHLDLNTLKLYEGAKV